MTKGNHYNCPCPYCGKTNHHIMQGVEPPPIDGVHKFPKQCVHCKHVVHYWAQWEIRLTAEKEELTPFPKPE